MRVGQSWAEAGGVLTSGRLAAGHSLHNDKVRRAPRWTGQIQAGRGGRLTGLGAMGPVEPKTTAEKKRRANSQNFSGWA
jgi:hypothetical protein